MTLQPWFRKTSRLECCKLEGSPQPPPKRLGMRAVSLLVLQFAVIQSSTGVANDLLSGQGEKNLSQNQSSGQETSAPPTLEMGKPVEKELSGGESHSYRIALAAGQYLHIVVDQRGIDVVVALYGPDDKKLKEVDSPNGTNGPEPLSWIAATTGPYRLEVRSLEKDAKAGKYEAGIETLRPATLQDSYRARAEENYREGWMLESQETTDSRRKALEKFSAALADWRAAEDKRQEVQTLNSLGLVLERLGERQMALEYYSQALPMLERAGDQVGEAVTLNNIGLLYADLGEKRKALQYYSRVLPILRRLSERDKEATALNNIGNVYDSLGEKQEALEHYNQALAIYRTLGDRGDRGGEAVTLNNIGALYYSKGENRKALEFFDQSLPIFQKLGDRRSEATTLNNIGMI